jgi:dihydrofolate synthase/folylpolyglutamate synthase
MVYKKYMVPSTPPAPQNADDVHNWLSQYINLEMGLARRDFSLESMKILAEKAGFPERCAPSIHMAGSKGKGSVTGMISSILSNSGFLTARYTSPHVNNIRERITLGSNFFSEESYASAGRELMELVENLRFEASMEPSFFELITLWFFLCARRTNCEVMAVETGMGGRLDATNILDPLVSVITIIELEHTEYLGNTITAIAGEKAGIIKPKRPLVLAEQSDEALSVFKEQTARHNSPLFYFPENAEIRNIRLDQKGTLFDLRLKNKPNGKKIEDEILSNLFIPVPGEIQAKNAGLAVMAVKTAFPHIQNQNIYDGLAAFTLPARFERISEKPPFVIDGAHTKRSIELCLQTFNDLYGQGGLLIFGCAAEKDVHSMAELCVPCFSTIIITTPGTFKKSFPEEIYAVF